MTSFQKRTRAREKKNKGNDLINKDKQMFYLPEKYFSSGIIPKLTARRKTHATRNKEEEEKNPWNTIWSRIDFWELSAF